MIKRNLRLATWNIHMAIGRDGHRDLSRIVQVIRQLQVEVVGLQEVDNQVEKGRDDLQTLAEQTGLTVIAGPTIQRARRLRQRPVDPTAGAPGGALRSQFQAA